MVAWLMVHGVLFHLVMYLCTLRVAKERIVKRETTKDYLLLPSDWALHKSDGDKAKIGTYDPATKMLSRTRIHLQYFLF